MFHSVRTIYFPTFDGTFALTAPDHDVTISGISVKIDSALSLPDKSIFSILAGGTNAGKVTLKNVTIEGQTGANAKTSKGISIAAPNVTLDGVKLSNFSDAAYIAANSAKIINGSDIHDNKTGVHIAANQAARGKPVFFT